MWHNTENSGFVWLTSVILLTGVLAATLSCRMSRKARKLGALSGMYLFSTDQCHSLLEIFPRSAVNPETLPAPEISIHKAKTPEGRTVFTARATPGSQGDVTYLRICRPDEIDCRETLVYPLPRVLPELEPGENIVTGKTCVWNDRNTEKHGLFEVVVPEYSPDVLTCGSLSYTERMQIPQETDSDLARTLYMKRTAVHRHIYSLRSLLRHYLHSAEKPPDYLGNRVQNLLNIRESLHLFFLNRSFYQTISMTRELLKAYTALSGLTPFSRGVMAPCASLKETTRLTADSAYKEINALLYSSFENHDSAPVKTQNPFSSVSGLDSLSSLAAMSVLSMGGVAPTTEGYKGSGFLYQDNQQLIHSGLHGWSATDSLPAFVAGAGIGHSVTGSFKILRSIHKSKRKVHHNVSIVPEKAFFKELWGWSAGLLYHVSRYRNLADLYPDFFNPSGR